MVVDILGAPIERYLLTSCNHFHLFSSVSNNNVSILGTLHTKHPKHFDCDGRDGVHLLDLFKEPALLESEFSLEDSLMHDYSEQFRSNTSSFIGFSMSTWFIPTTTIPNGQIQPIVSLASTTNVTGFPQQQTGGCPGYDFQIAQFYNDVLISYVDNNPSRSCRFLRLYETPLQKHVLTHVVVTLEPMWTNVYLNGKGIKLRAPNFFDATLNNNNHWKMNSTLQLFGTKSSHVYFQGFIQQVDIFDRAFNMSQVVELNAQGVIRNVTFPEIRILARAPSHPIVIRQDAINTTISVQLGSDNKTTSILNLFVDVLSLPKHGHLLYQNRPVTNRTHWPIPRGNSSVLCSYQLHGNDSTYFNVPKFNAWGKDMRIEPEILEFRIVAVLNQDDHSTEEEVVVATSTSILLPIYVRHVNHAPGSLTAPKDAIVDVIDPGLATVPNIDFSVKKDDFNLDRVRVDVSADSGLLTLLPAYQPLANFTCSNRICQGDGVKDRKMTFLAVPSDVRLILRNLQFTASTTVKTNSSQDFITIRILDGAGGDCLNETDHVEFGVSMGNDLFTSVRDACYKREVRIRVPLRSNRNQNQGTNKKKSSGLFGRDYLDAPDLIGYGLLISLLAALAMCLRRFVRCLLRGRAVDPDNPSSKHMESPFEHA